MNCECDRYEDIPLDRESINRRIKESKRLRKQFEPVAEYQGAYSHNRLLRCLVCRQLWQQSAAWNFGAKEYLFKVPPISVEDWQAEPYAQPDEMMICAALNEELLSQSFEERDCIFLEEGCKKNAVRWHTLCRQHFDQGSLVRHKCRLSEPYREVV